MRFDEMDATFERETPGVGAPGKAIAGRILWPALGFPAVIAPRSGAPASPADSDATRTICVLVLTNAPTLSPQDASRYLRCVSWAERQARGSGIGFSAGELSVRRLSESSTEDTNGRALTFGGDRQQRNAISVSLSKYVRQFYSDKRVGLELHYLHEIRVAEAAAAARLTGEQYHVFWNSEGTGPAGHSAEMRALLEKFVPKRLPKRAPGADALRLLTDGYAVEYGGLLPRPHTVLDPVKQPADVLHPIFVRRNLPPTLRIGHVTDTHVDIRNDAYARNLARKAGEVQKITNGRRIVFNNWNDSFQLVYNDAKSKSDVILMTGDLIDYGRGHLGRPDSDHELGRDDRYYFDRNWFLFYYLLATKDNYRTPVYTTLGNHDWRQNPYPPFAPGAPSMEELIHNSIDFKPEEHEKVLKKVIELAHGPGHERRLAYADLARDVVEVVKTAWKAKQLVPSLLFGSKASLDYHKLPTHTTVDSIAWYLLTINPFLDYRFALPTAHQFLLLDFGEQEELKYEVDGKGQGPRALSCLTPIQQWHVDQFLKVQAPAKILGMHTPPIGPRPDWSVNELKAGLKTYTGNPPKYLDRNWDRRWARNTPLPLFALLPERFLSPWLVAQYGSFVNKDTRKWLIERLRGSSVRAVVSGHIHRQGLLTVRPQQLVLPPPGPREPSKMLPVLAVRSVEPQEVRNARVPNATPSGVLGPVYVNTTSAGPKGYQYFENSYWNVAPGFTLLQLTSDGTIASIVGGPAYPVAQQAKVANR